MRTRSLLTALVLFLFAFAVRRYFYCGLVLGDDGQEYALMLHVLSRGPDFHDQYHLRFGVWIFNYLSFFLFGISEWSLMLPNWALSSVLGIVAYALLRRWGYDQLQAFLGGLFVVSAPFEVLAGTLRVNDLFLGLAMALGLWALVRFEERPLLQGLAVALCLWFGFYVKLWAVYVLPALGVYYVAERRWRGLAAVTVASLVIHGATCAFWHAKVGSYLPFIEAHAVNWVVPRDRLVEVFLTYPKLIFQGSSEFGTTLFGAVPYLLLALLLVKVLATALRVPASSPLRLDRADRMLLVLWGSFFLLLDFFPNGFQFDAYYSVPRIFRYITPMSFPMTLHAAKLLLDVTRLPALAARPAAAALTLLVPAVLLNLYQTDEATKPGQIYRRAFMAVLHDVEEARPPKLVAEALVASYFRDLYLDPETNRTDVIVQHHTYKTPEYEAWLRAHESSLPEGTMLVTGLASYVHYGAHEDGYRLTYFSAPLSPRWELVRTYNVLTYLPRPEPARLWRLRGAPTVAADGPLPREDVSSLADVNDFVALTRDGMARYQKEDYAGARVYFRKIIDDFPDRAEDAVFFYAASFFRQSDWPRARKEFKRLAIKYRHSRWTPAAYWHIATCDRNLGDSRRAQERLEYLVAHHADDPLSASRASADLKMLRMRREGLLGRLWRAWVGPARRHAA